VKSPVKSIRLSVQLLAASERRARLLGRSFSRHVQSLLAVDAGVDDVEMQVGFANEQCDPSAASSRRLNKPFRRRDSRRAKQKSK